MKIVWVNGTFDVMHLGHIKLLEFAKSLGDFLVVGIDQDHRVRELKGSSRPINTCQYRIDFLKSIKYVDSVVTFETDSELTEHIKSFKPTVMVVGSDYIGKRVIGSEWAGEVKYFDRFEDLSTSKILKTHG
jgi:D-beta-D-heptose 7-phosphate kinase/D-beta-D-heptose 1-phosphate adenosyltransferase